MATPLSSWKISFSGAISPMAWRNSSRRLRLAALSRSTAWSDFFCAPDPSGEELVLPGSLRPGHRQRLDAPAARPRSGQAARAANCANCLAPLRACSFPDRGETVPAVSCCRCAPDEHESFCYNPNSHGTGPPIPEDFPLPLHRTPGASNANHPNKAVASARLRGDRRLKYEPNFLLRI